MRRKILTIALATAAGWTAPAMAQVVIGGQGNTSVIVDYSAIGLPGGPSSGTGGYPYGSYAPGGTNLVMPNGQAPRSQFLADDIFGDTTVIGGSTAYILGYWIECEQQSYTYNIASSGWAGRFW